MNSLEYFYELNNTTLYHPCVHAKLLQLCPTLCDPQGL